ncbi:hypothetical protein L8106_19531 [Lyngbya sp. PCC 8106]|nr:hypothetical protein L8106_19531 [Lyngbya sp. PCC 8106]
MLLTKNIKKTKNFMKNNQLIKILIKKLSYFKKDQNNKFQDIIL